MPTHFKPQAVLPAARPAARSRLRAAGRLYSELVVQDRSVPGQASPGSNPALDEASADACPLRRVLGSSREGRAQEGNRAGLRVDEGKGPAGWRGERLGTRLPGESHPEPAGAAEEPRVQEGSPARGRGGDAEWRGSARVGFPACAVGRPRGVPEKKFWLLVPNAPGHAVGVGVLLSWRGCGIVW